MQKVAVPWQHDVAVMAILNIENVAENGVTGKGPNEITLGFIELGSVVPLIELV